MINKKLIWVIFLIGYSFSQEVVYLGKSDTKHYFVIEDKSVFPKEFISYLESGIIFNIKYTIDVYEKRAFYDRKVLSEEINKKFYYDYWGKSYLIKIPKYNYLRYFGNVDDLFTDLKKIKNLIFDLDNFKDEKYYKVIIKRSFQIENMTDFFYILFVIYSYLKYSFNDYSSGYIKGDEF